MNVFDARMVHLAVNFVERMKNQQMDRPNVSLSMKSERNKACVEFFTGAYVCARVCGEDKFAEYIGVYTKEVLAPLGYERCQLLAKGCL